MDGNKTRTHSLYVNIQIYMRYVPTIQRESKIDKCFAHLHKTHTK